MALRFAVVLFAALSIGCAALQINPWDHPAKKTAKIAVRVPIAIVTFRVSELDFACRRSADPERCWQEVNAAFQQAGIAMQEAQRQQEEAALKQAQINALNASAERDRAAAFQRSYPTRTYPTRTECTTRAGLYDDSLRTTCQNY